jgi:23S rRNA pseudouridine1911/1915/1917 synthase
MVNGTEDMESNIQIIYEDSSVLVINKPAGLVVHAGVKGEQGTLADWVLKNYPEMKDVGEEQAGILRPGIVHRLDKDTTGVMILAKTQDAFLLLKKQFKERNVSKVYRAFVHGVMKEEKGSIDRPMGRSAKDFRLRSAGRGAKGELREAVTDWRCIKNGEEYSYIEVLPKTGRTHQIRVHMKAINHPLVCDMLYAPKRACALGFDRLALHAFSLTLAMPDGNAQTFEAPLPEDFQRAERLLK